MLSPRFQLIEHNLKQKAHCAGLKFVLQALPVIQWFLIFSSLAVYFILKNEQMEYLLPWCLFIIAVNILWMIFSIIDLKKEKFIKKNTLWLHTVFTALTAFLFGIGTFFVFSTPNQKDQIFISSLFLILWVLVTFILSSVKSLFCVWLGIIATFILINMTLSTQWSSPVYIFYMTLFLAFTGVLAPFQNRLFMESFLNRYQLEKKDQIIGLLLRDFDSNAGDWLWQTNKEGMLTSVSERMCSAFGVAEKELRNQYLPEVIFRTKNTCNIDGEESLAALKRLLNKPEPFTDFMVNVRINGRLHWWLLTAAPEFSERGEHIGWLGVAKDISSQKVYEQEIEWQANYDSLTGLSNRYHLHHLLDTYLQNMEEGTTGALAVIHIRNFRLLNTTLGQIKSI